MSTGKKVLWSSTAAILAVAFFVAAWWISGGVRFIMWDAIGDWIEACGDGYSGSRWDAFFATGGFQWLIFFIPSFVLAAFGIICSAFAISAARSRTTSNSNATGNAS